MDEHLWEQNDGEHKRIESRLDAMLSRLWWLLGILVPIMLIGSMTAIAVWADTQVLKRSNAEQTAKLRENDTAHVTRGELSELRRERQRIDTQQTKALNWQTQAIEAIARKVGASDMPSRPPMIEGETP